MSELDDRLSRLLSDPESMGKMLELASSMLNGTARRSDTEASENTDRKPSSDTAGQTAADDRNEKSTANDKAIGKGSASSDKTLVSALPAILEVLDGKDVRLSETEKNRLNLLLAIKPFIGDERCRDIDRTIRLVKVAESTKSAFGKLSGEVTHV